MSDWKTGLQLKIEMKTAEFHAKLTRLIEISKTSARDLVIDNAKRFAGAARREMPPDAGKGRIEKSSAYRPVRDISQPDAWVDAKVGRVNRNAHFGGNYSFAVPYRKPDRRSGVKFFASKAEAESFSAIPTRGAGRYGWAQATVALGGQSPAVVPAGFPFAGLAGSLMAKAGSTKISGTAENPVIEIENHSTAAGEMHLMRSELAGRRIAVAGMNRGIKAIEKEMEAVF